MISYQRPQSVASMKGTNKGRDIQSAPRLGTATRAVYDVLVENIGHAVVLPDVKNVGGIIEQLKLYYGLDIRKLRQGSPIRGKTVYVLAGYWDGTVYHDFIAC